MAALTEYLWIAVCGGILAFAYGFLIGANDVANAFASSVSSKSITVAQAVMIAAIFEFSGAYLLGAAVTGTIRNKIVDIDLYEDEPALFMFGMFSALFSANLNLWCATAWGYPVSTTHDIVGSIMGFSIAAKGFDSVQWKVAIKIFISWFASPCLSGTVAAAIFASVKYGVLKSENTFQRAFWTFPIIITLAITVNIFFVLFKAFDTKPDIQDKMKWYIVLPISLGVGFCCGLVWLFGIGPIAVRRVEEKRARREADEVEAEAKEMKGVDTKEDSTDDDEEGVKGKIFDVDGEDDDDVAVPAEQAPEQEAPKSLWGKFADATYKQDLHTQAMTADTGRTQEVWDNTVKYDEDTENLFTYLQVFTACLNSFSHGANDVANTISPMSAIITVYQTGEVASKAAVEKWKLAFGGAAIVIGLLLYGYKVMQTLGFKLIMISPSRGFSAELGASLVVVTASFIGIPVSTTQCIVGAVFGVGLVSGCQNVQWFYLFKVCCSWVILFFCAVTLAAGVFSFGAFSPSVN